MLARQALDKQWKADLQWYQEIEIPAWQAVYKEIDEALATEKATAGVSKHIGKKPPYPPFRKNS